MSISTDMWIDNPREPVVCDMHPSAGIARISIGDLGERTRILLSPHEFTPVEQKAWLTNLARQVQLLAASIPVGDEPDAEVRTVLGVVGA